MQISVKKKKKYDGSLNSDVSRVLKSAAKHLQVLLCGPAHVIFVLDV